MKAFLSILAGFAVIVGILAIVIFGRFMGLGFGIVTLPLTKLESQLELNQGVIKKTYDTEYCLANYEWFKDTSNDITQSDSQIQNKSDQVVAFEKSAGDRVSWTFEDKQQYNRLTNEETGLKNYRLDLVGQYNSRTSQLNRVACKDMPLFVQP